MSVPAGNARRPFNNFEGEEEKRLAEPPVIDAQQDCALFEDLDGSFTELAPGEFIIALPQDIHKPNCPGSKSSRSKKMIFKVLLDE